MKEKAEKKEKINRRRKDQSWIREFDKNKRLCTNK